MSGQELWTPQLHLPLDTGGRGSSIHFLPLERRHSGYNLSGYGVVLPSALINSVAISSIALGTERPSLRSGNHWKCCWRAGKESATTNQPVRALGCQEIIQGRVFPLDFRFQNQCSSPATGLPAPARAAMATARLRRTLDFLSTIFQTPIEIRAHSWWDGGYSRRRIGGGEAGGAVRVSESLSSLG